MAELQKCEEAADRGEPWPVILTKIYSEGVLQDHERAAEVYQKAADRGEAYAMIEQAKIYFDVLHNPEKGVKVYQKAADRGEPAWAIIELAKIYSEGAFGVRQDHERAAEVYQKAADRGEAYAITAQAKIYSEDLQDHQRAAEVYQNAADQGEVYAVIAQAKLYFEVLHDPEKGAEVYLNALDRGRTWVIGSFLGHYQRTVTSSSVYKEKAFRFFGKCAELKHYDCMYELGRCYRDGKGTSRDEEKARNWFKKGVEKSNTKSLFAWALAKVVPETLTPSQLQAVDDLSNTLNAGYVLKEWLKWAAPPNARYNQPYNSMLSLFNLLDATNAALLLADLLMSTLDPNHMQIADILITSIPTEERNTLPAVRQKLLELQVKAQHQRYELWYKMEMPNDKAFDVNDIVPIALIGEGQFGKVYLSWLINEQRYVAVKFIPFAFAKHNEIAATRVMREQLTCRVFLAKGLVREKNIVEYLGYTELVETQQRGLIFELCADVSEPLHKLADALRDEKIKQRDENIKNGANQSTNPLKNLDWKKTVRSSLRSSVVFCDYNKWTVAQVVSMLRQAGEALLEVHKVGFIHRDIADRNILCDAEGNVHLADFGLAKYIGSCEDDYDSFSPPAYSTHHFTTGYQYAVKWWAPECFGSEKEPGVFSWDSDVYAFGITMWQCFAHQDPFYHVTPEEGKENEVADRVKKRILKGKRPSLNKKGKRKGVLDENTPKALIKLIKLCWKQDPHDRPTMESVVDALRQIEHEVEDHNKSQGGRRIYDQPDNEEWFQDNHMTPHHGGRHEDLKQRNNLAKIRHEEDIKDRIPVDLQNALGKQLPYDVFLVHAGEQKSGPVGTMKHFLEEGNLRCFLDRDDLESGTDPQETMRFALATCRYAMVVLSKEFFTKRNPSSEFKCAFERMDWIRENPDYGWDSLHVVLYDMTVEDYKEKRKSCAMREYLPADLCDKVVVIQWKSCGDTKYWHDQCLKLKADLIRKDNDGAMKKWVSFLEGYAAEKPKDFPKTDHLYA